jgi:hypothetical protein
MSGGYPIQREYYNWQAIGTGNLATAQGVSIAPGNATKGSWTTLSAALATDCDVLNLQMWPGQNAKDMFSIDIGIGAAGSEIIILADLLCTGNTNTYSQGAFIQLPISIPAGTRVAARGQVSSGTGENCWISFQFAQSALPNNDSCSGVDALGYNSATTQGVSVTGPSTVGSKGSYATIIAATVQDYAGFFAAASMVTDGTGISSRGQSWDFAIGAAGSEVILFPDMQIPWTGEQWFNEFSPIVWTPIPAGSRLAARFSHGQGVSATIALVMYGIY